MSSIGLATLAFSPTKPSTGSYYKYHGNDEVEDLHHFMEHRHLRLQDKDGQENDDARDPGTKQWRGVSPVEEPVTEAFVLGFGCGCFHGPESYSMDTDLDASSRSGAPASRKVVHSSIGFAPIRL